LGRNFEKGQKDEKARKDCVTPLSVYSILVPEKGKK
jgi:hypothetical protein